MEVVNYLDLRCLRALSIEFIILGIYITNLNLSKCFKIELNFICATVFSPALYLYKLTSSGKPDVSQRKHVQQFCSTLILSLSLIPDSIYKGMFVLKHSTSVSPVSLCVSELAPPRCIHRHYHKKTATNSIARSFLKLNSIALYFDLF